MYLGNGLGFFAIFSGCRAMVLKKRQSEMHQDGVKNLANQDGMEKPGNSGVSRGGFVVLPMS